MKNDQILAQISEFCRHADMAESTFGRRAVNDGKLVHRLREGKRITIDTLNRIEAYIVSGSPDGTVGSASRSRSSGVIPVPTSAFLKTGKNICFSSIPAAKSG